MQDYQLAALNNGSRTNDAGQSLLVKLRVILLLPFLSLAQVQAQEFDEQYGHWPETLKINGQIIVNNGLEDFEVRGRYCDELLEGRTLSVSRSVRPIQTVRSIPSLLNFVPVLSMMEI